jgi:hypothetical protein
MISGGVEAQLHKLLTSTLAADKYHRRYLDCCIEHFSNQVEDVQQMLKGVVSSFYCSQ